MGGFQRRSKVRLTSRVEKPSMSRLELGSYRNVGPKRLAIKKNVIVFVVCGACFNICGVVIAFSGVCYSICGVCYSILWSFYHGQSNYSSPKMKGK
jgi:hypothetical protein